MRAATFMATFVDRPSVLRKDGFVSLHLRVFTHRRSVGVEFSLSSLVCVSRI